VTDSAKQVMAALFVSANGLKSSELTQLCSIDKTSLDSVAGEISTYLADSGLELIIHDSLLQLAARQSYLPEGLGSIEVKDSLSAAALEVLSIVAYRQPISRTAIEEIRGVGALQSIRGLLEKDLIAENKSTVGGVKITEYTTTKNFLMHIGIPSLDKLPKEKQ